MHSIKRTVEEAGVWGVLWKTFLEVGERAEVRGKWRWARVSPYKTGLPTRLPIAAFSMRCLHLVFNVVKLTTAPTNPIAGCHLTPPPLPEVIEGEEEYLVTKIFDTKMFCGRLKFKIKGYGPDKTAGSTQQKFMPLNELWTSTADIQLHPGKYKLSPFHGFPSDNCHWSTSRQSSH